MKILVCGGRDFDDYQKARTVLNKVHSDLLASESYCGVPILTVIHGGAKGADALASRWVKENEPFVKEWIFPAQWYELGRGAGMIRNGQMLHEGKPDLVVAFKGGRGTAHMVQISKKAGIKVVEVEV